MKNPILVLVLVASLFIAVGAAGLIRSVFSSPMYFDPTSLLALIGSGLLFRNKVARWGAIVCICGAHLFGLAFLAVILTSSTPRTFSWGDYVLPPAAGYLLVIGYFGTILAISVVAHIALVRKEVCRLFSDEC